MTIPDVVAKVKSRFRITGATLDTDITDAAETAVGLLAPYIKKSVVDSSLTLDSDAEQIDISDISGASGADVRRVEIKGTGSELWHPLEDYYKDGDIIFIQENFDGGEEVRLFLRRPYTVAEVAEVPATFEQATYDFASAEFAALLAGDKARYNIYSQSTGARGVDNMLDLSEFYENRAMRRAGQAGGSEAIA